MITPTTAVARVALGLAPMLPLLAPPPTLDLLRAALGLDTARRLAALCPRIAPAPGGRLLPEEVYDHLRR